MKIFVSRTGKGIDSLELEQAPAPGALGTGQIRVAMRAASVNYRDTMVVSGAFGVAPHGIIPCSDGAGEVTEVAPGGLLNVGDRVALTFNPDWIGGGFHASAGAMGRGCFIPGAMQEEIVVHHSEALLLPAHLSFEEGASFPCAGVTAWHALSVAVPLLPGMNVLLQGAGGVSLFALQFAKLFGARVIITSSSAETIDRSLAATRSGGRVALVGLLTGRPVPSSLFAGVDISSIKVGSRQDYEAMNRAVAFHKLKPVIDTRYRFEQLRDALHHLKSGKHMGKIVIGFD